MMEREEFGGKGEEERRKRYKTSGREHREVTPVKEV